MKIKPIVYVLLFLAAVGVGALLAQDQEKPAAADTSTANPAELDKQILDNQKKILERLEKMQEDIQFIKLKTAKC